MERTPTGVRVTLVGDLDVETAPQLHDVVTELGPHASGQVELDLSLLGFLDVAGARALAEAGDAVRSSGGHLTARRLPARLREVADRLGLGRYLEMAPGEDNR